MSDLFKKTKPASPTNKTIELKIQPCGKNKLEAYDINVRKLIPTNPRKP